MFIGFLFSILKKKSKIIRLKSCTFLTKMLFLVSICICNPHFCVVWDLASFLLGILLNDEKWIFVIDRLFCQKLPLFSHQNPHDHKTSEPRAEVFFSFFLSKKTFWFIWLTVLLNVSKARIICLTFDNLGTFNLVLVVIHYFCDQECCARGHAGTQPWRKLSSVCRTSFPFLPFFFEWAEVTTICSYKLKTQGSPQLTSIFVGNFFTWLLFFLSRALLNTPEDAKNASGKKNSASCLTANCSRESAQSQLWSVKPGEHIGLYVDRLQRTHWENNIGA